MAKKHKHKIVMITFQDHSTHSEGASVPFNFCAVGVLLEETKYGYHLAHWTRIGDVSEGLGEITSYIAKVKGLKIKTIASLVLPV